MSDKKKDKVDEITTINFSVTKCPLKIYKKFTEFCKLESNDNYAFGMKLLLDSREANVKELVLYEQYIKLKAEVDELREMVVTKTKTEKGGPKTFGSRGEKNE